MKVYFLKSGTVYSTDFQHGVQYTDAQIVKHSPYKSIKDVMFVEFVSEVFDEYDTNDMKEDELEVELGMLKKYGQTTLHGVRTTINPLYPTFRFTLYVCSERAGKVYSTKWLAQLPMWLWTMLPDNMNGPVTVKDFATTFQVFVKDEQRVWDIMEKMHGLECTLK